MKARKEYGIGYPNLYATPGYHDKADEFNRVQRSHQNYMEGMAA
jgi:glutathione S-transferase